MTKDKSIFIKNIYYMLSYAFQTLNQEIKDFYQFTPDDVKLEGYQTGEQIRDIPIAIGHE